MMKAKIVFLVLMIFSVSVPSFAKDCSKEENTAAIGECHEQGTSRRITN